MWRTLSSLLRIHSRPQNFGTKAMLLVLSIVYFILLACGPNKLRILENVIQTFCLVGYDVGERGNSICCLFSQGVAYLQYFFNWRSPFILNTQQQVVVDFNLHLLFRKQMMWQFLIKTIPVKKVLDISQIHFLVLEIK